MEELKRYYPFALILVGVIAIFIVSKTIINNRKEEAAAAEAAKFAQNEAVNRAESESAVKKEKEKDYGDVCLTSVNFIVQVAETYKQEKGRYPDSADEVVEYDERAGEMIGDGRLWVENGAPMVDAFFDKELTVTAYCTNGKKYEYTTEKGLVFVEDF